MNIELINASEISSDKLLETLNLAYSDYMVPLKLNSQQFQGMNHHYDFDLTQSCVAIVDSNPVGMGFLGVRDQRGWVGGMGVIPDFRGQGIGRKIMEQLINNSHNMNLDRLQLEVIEGNEPAHQLYLSLGFEEIRRLLILQTSEIPQSEQNGELMEVPLADALAYYSDFHQVRSPWQREYETLIKSTDLTAWLYLTEGQPMAYMIGRLTPNMIQIMDAAFVEQSGDAFGHLLSELAASQPGNPASMVNLPEDDPVWPALRSLGFTESLAQLEMVYALNQ